MERRSPFPRLSEVSSRARRSLGRTLHRVAEVLLSGDSERVLSRGDVYLRRFLDGKELDPIYLGQNKLTYAARVNVLRILARTSSHTELAGVTFPNDEGVDISAGGGDDVLPRHLWIGTGTTAATGADTGLDTRIGTVEYDLARIDVYEDYASYGDAPLVVGWEFDIPQGAVNGEGSPLVIQEWGLVNAAGDLLARRVAPVEKLFEMSLVARWEWRS